MKVIRRTDADLGEGDHDDVHRFRNDFKVPECKPEKPIGVHGAAFVEIRAFG